MLYHPSTSYINKGYNYSQLKIKKTQIILKTKSKYLSSPKIEENSPPPP